MATQDKIVQIAELSQDGNYTVTGDWVTFPSPGAELTLETAEEDNTIFGTGSFESSLGTIASHTLSMSAYLRETAGYNAQLKKGGSPTSSAGEPMSLDSGQTYVVTDSTKNFWDAATPAVVYDNSIEVDAADIESIDYLFGRVTFDAGYTVNGTVTVDIDYVATTAFGNANSVDITQTAGTNDTTTFESAQADSGFSQMEPALLTVDAELSGFYNTSSTFFAELKSQDNLLVEIDWTGTGEFLSRGLFRVISLNQSGDVGDVEETSVSLSISSLEGSVPYSFQFDDTAGSEVSPSFKTVSNAWLNREYIGFRYAPTGDATGEVYYEGKACITDTSISNSVDGIAELSVELQGTKELVQSTF